MSLLYFVYVDRYIALSLKVTFDVLKKELAAQADGDLATTLFNYGRRR